jgi:hypothetical protein
MTTERDFDRIARAWLDASPDEAPDRVIAAVLQAVDSTPQVRSPWRWLTWRSRPMNRIPLALGAAAIVAVAGALVLSTSGPGPDVGTSPTPESSSSPSGSPVISSSGSPVAAGGPVPTELRARWMGDHRGLVAPGAGTTIVLDQSTFALTQSNAGSERRLASSASSVGDGQIRLESTATANDCTKGDVGVYRWLLTSSGRTLTIVEDSDACPTRAGALAGSWWLMGCAVADDFCLGPLDAGTYKSQYIGPRVDPGATWTPEFGALTYTVPDGWANASDWPNSFVLMPSTYFPGPTDSDPPRSIGIVTQPSAMSQTTPCLLEPATGVARTLDGLVTWIDQAPGLVTTAPAAITIDGHPARWLELRIDPAFRAKCQGTTPSVGYLKGVDLVGVGLVGAERQRLTLVDLGDGDVVGIFIRTSDPAAFDAFVAEAMPIVESFRFK